MITLSPLSRQPTEDSLLQQPPRRSATATRMSGSSSSTGTDPSPEHAIPTGSYRIPMQRQQTPTHPPQRPPLCQTMPRLLRLLQPRSRRLHRRLRSLSVAALRTKIANRARPEGLLTPRTPHLQAGFFCISEPPRLLECSEPFPKNRAAVAMVSSATRGLRTPRLGPAEAPRRSPRL